MPFISDNLNRIKPSATMVITAKAAQLKREGKKVIGLSSGEPDFDTPEHVKEAAIIAINKGYTKYTNIEGIPELRQSIVEKFKNDNNLDYTINDIIVGTGGKQILYNALVSSLNENDEVIIPAPYWVSYPDMTLLAGGKPIIVNCSSETDFKLTANALEKVITKNSKWLILNSPSNPTGSCYSQEELDDIARVVRKHDNLHVMTDDIYEYILYDNYKFFTFAQVAPDLKDRTLTVNGVSKSYCMTGWRIGYAAGPEKLIKAMIKIQGQSTSNPSSISQYAAMAGISGSKDFLIPCLQAFDERRHYVVNKLNSIPGISCIMPKGAFYAYPNVEGLLGKKTKDGKILDNDTNIVEWLLDAAEVAAVPGAAFGLEPYFRVSYATSLELLKEAMSRIEKAVLSLT
ncbi:MAG: pyridoxal phosphate-dependent aminotransferase [Candidatus Puniceispirillales bacterium]|jgi:aspartate aminotransferase|nr:pyridoxal phosphate-dependent aminotransferase [Alphaproteobacteria bacterium]MBL6850560.1 pyridoxal phosphate-dependent aminotransferase [Alphaproteobacteria bacterium]